MVHPAAGTMPRTEVERPALPRHVGSAGAGGLDCLLRPRSVAVIGASERPGSVGGTVLQNLIEGGFRGSIVPVNPKWKTVHGRPAVARIADISGPVDLAVICTPASTVASLVRECGEAGVGGLLILSAGFRETGSGGLALEHAVREELARWPQMRTIGPNCLGLLTPALGLNASFAHGGARAGGVAFLSQSGALCTAFMGWARDEDIGFSHFLSVGNMLDVGFGDLLDYLADDRETTSVVLYVEAITDAERFLAAAGRCTAKKPVIAYKAGRNRSGARAAASHTGAMAGDDAVYDAAFEKAGVIRVRRLDDLLATAELLGRRRWPAGPRLVIVTNAGGPGVIATDALMSGNGELAQLSEGATAALDSILPPHWSHANPVDVIGDATAERLAAAVEAVMDDPGVDGIMTIVTPQAMIDTAEAARSVAAAASKSRKPVLAVWMGGDMVREGTQLLQSSGVPTYATPEQGVEAFLHLAAHARHLASRGPECRIDTPVAPVAARERAQAESILKGRYGILGVADSRSLLSHYGLQSVKSHPARSRDEAVAVARRLGYPVVLKVLSPAITHKTDVGGVRLDLRTDEHVALAFEGILQSVARCKPEATVEGVTVESMLDRSQGVELILGAKRDAIFGPIVLVGAGGTAAEVLADWAIGLAPISVEGAHRLLNRLKIAPLLGAFRGRQALNWNAVITAMVGVSRLIADHPSVAEVDANPVLVTPDDALVLDARVVLCAEAGHRPGPGESRN